MHSCLYFLMSWTLRTIALGIAWYLVIPGTVVIPGTGDSRGCGDLLLQLV